MKKKGYFSNLFTKVNNAVLKNKFLRDLKSIYYYIDGIILCFIRKSKNNVNNKKKVIIVYNLSLGDGAMFNCALKNIREIYPIDKYEITIATQKGLSKIYEATDFFDNVIKFNFTKATVNIIERIRIFKKLREEEYDILIDPIGIEECSTNILMSRAVLADKKIGIINWSREPVCPKKIYNKIYNEIIEIDVPQMHLLDHYFEFFNKLGNLNKETEFATLPSEKLKEEIPEKYFIVYPSASTEYKRWSIEKFAEITKRIYNELKIPVMICGTNVDRNVNNELIKFIKNDVKYIDFTGKTSILQYIELIKKARFVITNDTGIYHVAVVSEVPVAIIAGAYTYDRYLSYNFKGKEKYKRPYIICNKMECANCENRCINKEKISKAWPCLENINLEQAWNVIKEMIAKENK